jgi:hypothetical protein
MDDVRNELGVVEKEKVRVIPTRKGEELHFTVTEVEGGIRGDIRFFVKIKGQKGMLAVRRGIAVLPEHYKAFQEGVAELGAKLESYSRKV